MTSILLRFLSATLLISASLLGPVSAHAEDKILKVGLVGLDNSHALAFTKALNDSTPHAGLEGARIVAAFPGGSPDLPVSADRVKGFTETISGFGVQMVSSLEELLPLVDAVIISSVDGRVHPQQAQAVIAAGKPLFIDKPMAVSVADAAAVFSSAKKQGVSCFSTSSLRFCPEVIGLTNSPAVGEIVGCVTYSPCATQLHHPDLFWYGIHGVETIYALMGPGCETVTCTRTNGTDTVVGVWKDGRIATFRGGRDGKSSFGAVAFGSKGTQAANIKVDYEPMLVQIIKSFRTGEAPVPANVTLEVLAFMEAANESAKQGGKPVPVKAVPAIQ